MRIFLFRITIILLFASYSHAEDLSGYSGTVYFDTDFESGYQYMGIGNAHSGGGYFSSMGGTVAGDAATLPNPCASRDTDTYHYTVISDDVAGQSAVTGSGYALKTPYTSYCTDESTSRDRTSISLSANVNDVYIRWYQKWTGTEWYNATVQHKWSKFTPLDHAGDDNYASGYFTFGVTNLIRQNSTPNLDDRWSGKNSDMSIYCTEADADLPSTYRDHDGWDNEVSGVGTDVSPTFVKDTWYCLEMHIKMNTDANTADGTLELWVDGVKYFWLQNFKWYNAGSAHGVGFFELQHVFYNRSAYDDPTYMDNIVIGSTYIGPIGFQSHRSGGAPSGGTGAWR